MKRKLAYLLPLCLLFSCGGPETEKSLSQPTTEASETQTSAVQEKDLVNFTLPQEVTDVSGSAQTHFYRMLPMVSPSYKIRPEWVFIDKINLTLGRADGLVSRMDFFHFAYFEGKELKWYGSVLLARDRGTTLFTGDNRQLDLIPRETGYEIGFKSGETSFKTLLEGHEDKGKTLVEGDHKIFVYRYIFPDRIFKSEVGGTLDQ